MSDSDAKKPTDAGKTIDINAWAEAGKKLMEEQKNQPPKAKEVGNDPISKAFGLDKAPEGEEKH